MKINTIAYEKVTKGKKEKDEYLIKANGEIFNRQDDKFKTFAKGTPEDFQKLEAEVNDFIEKAEDSAVFFDDTIVQIMIVYENHVTSRVERGLTYDGRYFGDLIENYIAKFTK